MPVFREVKDSSLTIYDPEISGDHEYITYRSELKLHLDSDNQFNLFSYDEDATMFYHQQGLMAEIGLMIESSNEDVSKLISQLGYQAIIEENIDLDHRVKKISQRMPNLDRWNRIINSTGSNISFIECDEGKYRNIEADHAFGEYQQILVSKNEPWGFHDRSYHPLGYLMLSGPSMQSMLSEIYETIKEHRVSNPHLDITFDRTLWYQLDLISDDFSSALIHEENSDYIEKILEHTDRLSFLLPPEKRYSFLNRYKKFEFALTLNNEMFNRIEETKHYLNTEK